MITFERVTKRYDGSTAVDELSFEIADGQIVILVGPSGCGKTTTLKMINRLIEPTPAHSDRRASDGRARRERSARRLATSFNRWACSRT